MTFYKLKLKLSLCFTKYRAMETYRRVELNSLLISAQ